MKLNANFWGISTMLFAVMPLVSLFGASQAKAQSPNAAQIVFLHCKMKNDTLTFVKSNIRPGVVKQRRGGETRGEIAYEVLSSSGELLWHGEIEDPLLQRFEYADPANPGRIKIKYVKLNEGDFTLRLPFKPEAHRIKFYRLESSAEKDRQKFLRRPIGNIILPINGREAK
jgi:hypothetical protein